MVHEEPDSGDRSALDALNSEVVVGVGEARDNLGAGEARGGPGDRVAGDADPGLDGLGDRDDLDVGGDRRERAARDTGAGVGRRRGAARTGGGWSDRLLTLCVIAGLVALFTVPRTWARATLSDRGAHLLVATRSGWELAPTGALVGTAAVLSIVLCLLVGWTGRRRLIVGPLACGLAIVALALGRLNAADPLEHTIGRLRIGTFQTDEPVTASGPALWLWVAVVCGVVMVGAAAGCLALGRSRPRPGPAGRPVVDGRSGRSHRGL
ncbi:hypothetical protein [Frankia sp. R82]|uniref:hypothetical protein n=1 Tax=Frankia sp. R82 TaxID=2950553 RepID=UPI002044799C|nr:hypothetical protein [Frankia sp. R82]MCM3886167.1 hypothetical protein [Frankia sp. R82]